MHDLEGNGKVTTARLGRQCVLSARSLSHSSFKGHAITGEFYVHYIHAIHHNSIYKHTFDSPSHIISSLSRMND